jgi:hypothetical protein
MDSKDCIITEIINKCKNAENFTTKIEIQKNLLNLSLEDLIKLIDIKDVNTYLLITHRFISKKDKDQQMKLIHHGKLYEFSLNTFEQQQLLCCKTKRKDELIKFSFKFIRRELVKKFRATVGPTMDKMKVKHMFNKRYLHGNKGAIKYFESFDVSKKGLKILDEFKKLKTMMLGVQKKGYIEALIKEYIWKKGSQILEDSFSFRKFVEEILSRQHKHSMVVQGVLNSLNQFEHFFYV